jgi:hypothetical protein
MTQVRRTYPDVTFDNFVAESVRVAEASWTGPITFSHRAADQRYVDQLRNVGQEFFDQVVQSGEAKDGN